MATEVDLEINRLLGMVPGQINSDQLCTDREVVLETEPMVLTKTSEAYRKMRATARANMLKNLEP